MVVFACNACGASVKKNQVEKHYQQQCRRCESLSCMDCGQDFWGEQYKHHNKCITEDEKYAAKGWQPKASANKGERKQEAWIEAINKAVDSATNMTPSLKQLLETLTQHSNIPRKKKKFENFVRNSVHVRNPVLVDQAWTVFEAAVDKQKEEPTPTNVGKTKGKENGHELNGITEDEAMPQKKKAKKLAESSSCDLDLAERKKSKREKKVERSKKVKHGSGEVSVTGKRKLQVQENMNDESHEDSTTRKTKRKLDNDTVIERLNATLDDSAVVPPHHSNKFDWKGVVLALLGNRDDHEMPLKKLRKKVVNEYQSRGGEGKPNTTKEEIWAKLDKKLKRMPQVKVFKENVKLSSG